MVMCEEKKVEINSAVIGLMNFSVLFETTTAYKEARKKYTDYKKSILNSDRLKIRENIFFKHTVPVLISAAEKLESEGVVLKFAVAIAELLPSELQDKFNNLAADYSHIFRVVTVNERQSHSWREVLNEEMENVSESYVIKKSSMTFANFRLDDDDVLSEDYFNLVKGYLSTEFHDYYISFPKGYVGFYDAGYKGFYKSNRPFLAIGLLKVCEYSLVSNEIVTENPSVYSCSHTNIVENERVVLDSRIPVYIWTVHYFSDTWSVCKNKEHAKNKIDYFIESNKLENVGVNEVKKIFRTI